MKVLTKLVVCSLLVPALALAQAPTFSAKNFSCEEVQEAEDLCLGWPAVNGERIRKGPCIRKADRKLTRTRRRRRRTSDPEKRAELLTLIEGYRDAKRVTCAACWNYETETCSSGGETSGGESGGGESGGGESGGGGSGCGTTTPTISQACEIAANPQGPNISSTSIFVANGEECTDASKSPVVAITYFGSSFCSGTVISSNKVLTAAHCFESTSTTGIAIQLQDGTSFSVSNVKVNGKWAGGTSNGNDTAILTTSNTISNVTPASVYTGGGLSIGASVVIAGYGVFEQEITGILRATVNQIENIDSNSVDTYYEVGNNEGSSCVGDSGGPLFACVNDEWQVVGTTSTGGPAACAVNGAATYDDAQFSYLSAGNNPTFIANNS